jgi:hypothetical protein
MTRQNWPARSAVAGLATVGLGCLVAFWMPMHLPAPLKPSAAAMQISQSTVESAPAAANPAPAVKPADAAPVSSRPQVAAAGPLSVAQESGYYSQLRSRLRWVQTRVGSDYLLTPDLDSRMLLAKSAARRAGLGDVGLSFKDVYGLINAETSWVPRTGASKNGTPNLGIAQFEPATAKALGMRNPNDPVEAVHVAAVYMKEAAIWSADRIAALKLGADDRAARLREGVSIYYNLSIRGRNAWNGSNTGTLPRETQRHIQNARIGAQQAEFFDAQLQAMSGKRNKAPAVVTASSLQSGG